MSNGNGPDFDPNDLKSWITVLHNASRALRDNPQDEEARQWVDTAKQNISDLNQLQARRDVAESQDLGGGAAFALGAARGMSFGLSDLGQRLALSPEEKKAVSTTGSEHQTATKLGTVAGAAVPFVLGGGVGAGGIGARTAIGAAQGAGLTEGDVGDRLKGAVLAAALARYGPEAISYLAKTGRGLASRLLGGLAPRAAPEAAEALPQAGRAIPRVPSRLARTGAIVQESGAPRDAIDDIARAQADFAAGRISEQDFNTAMEVASRGMKGRPLVPGRPLTPRSGDAPFAGETRAQPISEGSPGSGAAEAMETPSYQRIDAQLGNPPRAVPIPEAPAGVGNAPVNPEAAAQYVEEAVARSPQLEEPVAQSYKELVRMTREGLKPKVGYFTRGGELEQSLAPPPSGSPAGNPSLAMRQYLILQEALKSGDPDAIRAVQALTGIE